MIKTSAAPTFGLNPLNRVSVSQEPMSKTSLVQKPLPLPAEMSRLIGKKRSVERKLYSYVKWETDAAHCDLNRKLVRPSSRSSPDEFLDALKLLAHKTPNLRILELGNGHDDIMRLCLEALRSNTNERLYSTYTRAKTSLDTAFKVKTTWKGAWNVDIVFLDIDQQPQDQLLEIGAYDLIIITDVRAPNHGPYLTDHKCSFFP